MKALGALLLLELLGQAWCCFPQPGDTNIARLGIATQSSTITDCYANKAIDGVKNLDLAQHFCSHTGHDFGPWWRLDMQQRYSIMVVVLGFRSDASWDRNLGLELRIGDSPDNNNPMCGKITDVTNFAVTFMCNGMTEQYISAVIPGRVEYLTLCEVEVYGDLVK